VPTPHPAADVLRLLADCDSSGTLQVAGPPGGAFRLDRGRVVQVDADGVPPGTGPAAVLDAAVELLGHPGGLPPRFATGRSVEVPPDRSHEVARLLLDVDRALATLARSPVSADDRVVAGPLRGRGVRLDAASWPLVGSLGRPVTARELAWSLGCPVLGTVLALADRVEQGACLVVARAPSPGQPGHPGAPAPASEPAAGSVAGRRPTSPVTRPLPLAPRPEPEPEPVPAQVPEPARAPGTAPAPASGTVPPLPVRRPGEALQAAVEREEAPPWAGGPARPATPDRPAPELVLRLMDGLRRL